MEEGPRSGRGGLVTRCVCALCCSRAHEKSRAVRFARQSVRVAGVARSRSCVQDKTLSPDGTLSPVSAGRTRSGSTNGSVRLPICLPPATCQQPSWQLGLPQVLRDARRARHIARTRADVQGCLVQFMSSQSGYHTTEDDNDEAAKSPPRVHRAAPAPHQPDGDAAALRAELHEVAVSSQGEIAYWKAQVDQGKQDMVEILGHAENLSQACEELEDEVASLKADNARLKQLAESAANSSAGAANNLHHTPSGDTSQYDLRSRLAVALGEEGGHPPLLELLAKGGVAQQLSAVAQRLRAEQRFLGEGTASDESGDVNRHVAEQMGLLGALLEGAAREILEQATELATEKEAHDVTASRLARLQKKYAVEEMKNSVKAAASGSGPVGSPGTPRPVSRPSRRPRSAPRQAVLSPNGSNWDETLRERIPADTETAAVVRSLKLTVAVSHSSLHTKSLPFYWQAIDHSLRSSILSSRASNGRRRPAAYPSAAPSPVRRREGPDQRSTIRYNGQSRPRAGSPPPQHSTAEAIKAAGTRSSRATSASRKQRGGRAAPTDFFGYRRTTAASLSHEPASVSPQHSTAHTANSGCLTPLEGFVLRTDVYCHANLVTVH